MKVLIVEDDPSIRFGLEEILSSEGYDIATCDRGDSMVEDRVAAFSPDLIVLDVMLPGRNGFDCCRDLRAAGIRMPVLMLTAKGQEADTVIGLECGADDYVTKPFGLRELTARIHALLRRATEFNTTEEDTPARIRIGDCDIDPANHLLRCGKGERPLTPRECSLLIHLHRHRGHVQSRDQILTAVWGLNAATVSTRTLDQTVAQLRKKLGDIGANAQWLQTVHGVGYRLTE